MGKLGLQVSYALTLRELLVSILYCLGVNNPIRGAIRIACTYVLLALFGSNDQVKDITGSHDIPTICTAVTYPA